MTHKTLTTFLEDASARAYGILNEKSGKAPHPGPAPEDLFEALEAE